MAIEIIGKCNPSKNEINRVVRDGFRKSELYMKGEYLSDRYLGNVLESIKKTGLKFYSIHTPHVKEKVFLDVLERTKEFARKANIPVIVAHSMYVDVMSRKITDRIDGNVFPENSYDDNLEVLRKVFKRGVKICLDVAHLHVASIRSGRNFYSDLETILTDYRKNVGHLHIADTDNKFFNMHNDHNIGEGEIDFYTAMKIIAENYSGVAVVETGTKDQLRDYKRLKNFLSFAPRKTSVTGVSRPLRKA